MQLSGFKKVKSTASTLGEFKQQEIDSLRAELETAKIEWHRFEGEYLEVVKELSHLNEIAEKLSSYVAHEQYCIRTFWQAGELTPNGGYREMFKGKWYQRKPVDKTPKCNCGRDKVFALWQQFEKRGDK